MRLASLALAGALAGGPLVAQCAPALPDYGGRTSRTQIGCVDGRGGTVVWDLSTPDVDFHCHDTTRTRYQCEEILRPDGRFAGYVETACYPQGEGARRTNYELGFIS